MKGMIFIRVYTPRSYPSSNDVASTICRYVTNFLGTGRIHLPSASFMYSAFHYAVSDILEENGIEKEVFDASSMMIAKLTGEIPVSFTQRASIFMMRTNKLNPLYFDDAKKILSLEKDSPNRSYLVRPRGEVSRENVVRYMDAVKQLRDELNTVFRGNRKQSSFEDSKAFKIMIIVVFALLYLAAFCFFFG